MTAASDGNKCSVVGIGASAGGLEAMEEFLRELGDSPRAAIAFVQHLAPNTEPLLGDLLRRKALIPGEATGLSMVVFQDAGLPIRISASEKDDAETECEAARAALDRQADTMIDQLGRELSATRDDLEKTMQEMEAANEELKSSNEELLSMNEER